MKRLWTLMILSGILAASPISIPENFKAAFTQRITNPDKKVIHYKGTIRFSGPKMLKWVYQEPTQKEVCSNGENVTVVDHDLEQVSYYLIEKGFDLAEILKTAKPYKETKTVFIAKYQGRDYTIQVDAKKRLSRVAYYDDLENEVLIIFEKMQYGKGKLPFESMLCEAPASYDVIGE
ncbi:LolA-like outer membrane lipoprotein chaperone [Sulfurovum sp.]|uniref:LolA-like outer membrane lipoprotein chaperone n=1 Tax=Sulfurovum sp. TaxID=1969726 RepID=UPI002A3599E0|nr:LolA-like outer membrane lipoprotein chaperone [Sulfurovum sp.]MDD2451406.1 LolA-like outer membrane lipoprotein chaperone [Sulfurovum sp.]MDD3499436.1 LolA-like outer membrane lipoprotein chaperone [Sulfurovum sp.]MDY0402966.1 LolA-like outer membrane lipoprotein chaperone [Sulfurovum sp.]